MKNKLNKTLPLVSLQNLIILEEYEYVPDEYYDTIDGIRVHRGQGLLMKGINTETNGVYQVTSVNSWKR